MTVTVRYGTRRGFAGFLALFLKAILIGSKSGLPPPADFWAVGSLAVPGEAR